MADTAKVYPVGRVHYQELAGASNTLSSQTAPGSVIVSTEAMTITIPESTTVVWPLGTQFFVVGDGAHVTTIAKTGSDTIVGDVASTAAAGATQIVTKITDTGWAVALAPGA